MATAAQVAERWSGFHARGWAGTVDGAALTVERGDAGDHRFVHGADTDADGGFRAGTRAVHHLSADASELACVPAEGGDRSWWRVVLDSVLFTIALLHGYEALHAAAVATPQRDGAIAITAPMGGGKSTLLSELLRRGLPLIADDVVVLRRSCAGAAPLAHPAPPLLTLPSARLAALDDSDSGQPAPICVLGEESWVAVPVHSEPLPLRSLVVLERRRGAALSLSPIMSPLAPLLSSLMRFPKDRARERARFEMASEIAANVGIWRLTADPHISPDVLADTLLDGVRDEVPGHVSASTHVCDEASRC